MPPGIKTKETIEFLYSLERHGIKPGLERITELLSLLGNPQNACPSVHIAGTNGKGSTAAFISSVLAKAGLKTGLYTSPHLIRFNERIRVSGSLISDREIRELVEAVRTASKKMRGKDALTFFEFTTVMAFLYFKLKKADIAVIETGMGGRLDATNVITPLVSVITNIALDHTEYLGDRVEDIAREKAGIIKCRVPVITGETAEKPLKVLRDAARKSGSRLLSLGRDFSITERGAGFDFTGPNLKLKGLKTSLRGVHQGKNAACALAAIGALKESGFAIPVSALRAGLKEAAWPGRVDILSKRPLVILDGAHNPSGASTLKAALNGLKYEKLILVLGIMNGKDIDGILRELAPMAYKVIITRPLTERAASLDLLEKKLARYSKPVSRAGTVKDACKSALIEAGTAGSVCVTGSLFTVGEALAYLSRALPQKRG